MSENILVVGGAGYIGSHMVLALQDAGYSVIVFDNLSRGFADSVQEVTFIQGDLRSISDLERCFSKYQINLVMHFAALAYVGESVHYPDIYYDNNVIGALNLLSVMRQFKANNFVFSSTCATYGEPQEIPIKESNIQNPINPYGFTKLVIERALADYAQAYQLNSVSLRYFNAAGCDSKGRAGERHDPETHLIPLVLAEALRVKQGGDPSNTNLKVFGDDFPTRDGSCVRDYIHVSDLCSAHLLAAKRLFSNPSLGFEAYNLGNGDGFSVFEVIEVCRQVTGVDIQYRQESRRMGDPATLIGDSALAKKTLSWNPQFSSLNEIIETAWSWMERQK